MRTSGRESPILGNFRHIFDNFCDILLNSRPDRYKMELVGCSIHGRKGGKDLNCGGFRMVTCISSGGTITLPEQIRNYLGLEPFDDLVFSVEDGVIVAAKVKEACKQYKAEE